MSSAKEVPAASNAELAAWLTVVRTYQKCERALSERLRPLGLSVPQHEVLLRLLHRDGLAQKALGERLLVTKGSVSVIVSRLEAAGLVERRPDPEDGRVSRVYLTEQGRSLAARGDQIQRQLVAQMFAPLMPSELEAFSHAAHQIERTLDAAAE